MKNITTNLLKLSALVIVAILIGITSTYAIGSLTPSGTAGDDTHYSLNDIYSKLVDFTDAPSATSSPFAAPGSVTASFRTLTEIYNILVAEEDDLVAENIRDGVTVFGVEGTMLELTPPLEWTDNQTTEEAADFTWSEATAICSALSNDGGGWRLPNVTELSAALLDQFVRGDLNGFTGGETYWSSDEDSSNAWYANWGLTLDTYTSSKSMGLKVRCVR